ncbi:hypothetical protein [Streptomyces phaeoluteigriseus]|uniref:hypothetical protein n=1 Tax=Streptomyces phaeoluteigriseus TaxID=114686 RepID=UPI001B8700F3|nr:hypothetical protein [Streptomyces phaeoluteigriseus]
MSETRQDHRLPQLWEEHLRAPFPAGFRGADLAGVDLVLLDAHAAGLVQRELRGGLDEEGVAILWACIAGLDKVLPLIGHDGRASYYARLRTMAGVTAARYTPRGTGWRPSGIRTAAGPSPAGPLSPTAGRS